MKFASFRPVIVLAALLFAFSACSEEERAGASAEVGEDTLLADASVQDSSLLRSLRLDLLRTAFRNLDAYAFTRHVQTEQLDDTGDITARESLAIRYQFRDGSRVSAVETLHTTGNFDYGAFGSFHTETSTASFSALADAFIPEEPPYLSPRSWDSFTYRIRPDTLIHGIRVGVFEIRAVPEATEQPAKHIVLYYDPASHAVIALHQELAQPFLVFRESTSLYVQARPRPDGQWLPDTTSVSTRIHLPLTETRYFRTMSRFADYSRVTPLSGGA